MIFLRQILNADEIFDAIAAVESAEEFLKEVPKRFLDTIWQIRVKMAAGVYSSDAETQVFSVLSVEKEELLRKIERARNTSERQMYENFSFLVRTSLLVLVAMIIKRKEEYEEEPSDAENSYKAFVDVPFSLVYELLKETNHQHAYFFLTSILVDFALIAFLGLKVEEIEESRLQLLSDFTAFVTQGYGGAAIGVGLIYIEIDMNKLQQFLTDKK